MLSDRSARLLVALALFALLAPEISSAQQLQAVRPQDADGKLLIERLQVGGLVMFFRHADTIGMPCDRSFKIGDRAGQRNISAAGREQSRHIGATMNEYKIPIDYPVLAGAVFRARDTAELAFGRARVKVTDSLLADDFSGARLKWVLDEHRRLFSTPPPAGKNRVLVGHRTPAIMVLGESVGGRAFPEGAALVLSPHDGNTSVLGILMLAPIANAGFHSC